MKKVILITLLIIVVQIAYSQTNYFKVLHTPSVEFPDAVVETESGDIIMIQTNYVEQDSTNYVSFLKLNQSGDTVANRIVERSDRFYSYTRVIKLQQPDGQAEQFVAIGGSYNRGANNVFTANNKLLFYTFNSNFDSISSAEINLPNSLYIWGLRDAIQTKNGHIVSLIDDMTHKKVLILKSSIGGDSISFNQIVPQNSSYVFSIMEKPESDGYYFTSDGYFNGIIGYAFNYIITLDTNLQYVKQDSLPGSCAFYSHIRPFNNSILVGGRAKRIWFNAYPVYLTEEYCIEKLDNALQPVKQVFLSHVVLNHSGDSENDTISYPALSRNFDFVDTNYIYTSHYREYPMEYYPAIYNYFVVSKFNSNLDLLWQYYFGFDAYYFVWQITALKDGGCFVSGSRYDYQTQNQEYDIFCLKLDSTGIFTSSGEPNVVVHSAMVFPNPGTDILHLESGPQVLGNYFQLYDLQGIKLSEVKITASQQQISTNNLPNGMYIWRIVTKGKIVDSGKWIKVE
ncbi:MAG: T9SS type A sorting domain-containing protein [Paludibacter sp.]|nr:T9SS type A sorting domain-containing protein [Paludibacter sp.]